MEAEDLPFQGFQAAGGGFDEQEMFAGGFYLSFQAVNRFDYCLVDIDAGGQVILDDGTRDLPCLAERGASHKHEAVLATHGFSKSILAEFSGDGLR